MNINQRTSNAGKPRITSGPIIFANITQFIIAHITNIGDTFTHNRCLVRKSGVIPTYSNRKSNCCNFHHIIFVG
ncbi:hypothetical protein DERP_010723 [Dermatophagoides pteronyssinus]|uniref:Uncharacterized protein n=1 Tax=Dermatophagoides pteronyssinus TaxID=6956 RepID=A0ABQ8J6Y9_DERPT|nr:hypothetical protein DERP_010723 [Dermatophagoides pteronyssinus]